MILLIKTWDGFIRELAFTQTTAGCGWVDEWWVTRSLRNAGAGSKASEAEQHEQVSGEQSEQPQAKRDERSEQPQAKRPAEREQQQGEAASGASCGQAASGASCRRAGGEGSDSSRQGAQRQQQAQAAGKARAKVARAAGEAVGNSSRQARPKASEAGSRRVTRRGGRANRAEQARTLERSTSERALRRAKRAK